MDMDQFNIPHQKVKEKSMYMLHLDTARIILISAAIIGIIIVSFLLGMNLFKGGEGVKALESKSDIFDGQKELDMLKNNIPDPPDEEGLSRPLDDKLAASEKEEKGAAKGKKETGDLSADRETKDDAPAISKNEPSDLLTSDNVDEVVVKGRSHKKKRVRDHTDGRKISRSSEHDPDDKPVRKATVKNDPKKKKRGKSKVVAVAVENEDQKTLHSGEYAIQVASFDKKSKAQTEVRSLKDQNYDAFIDESQVKGKQYFRVRIGPIASKKKALDLLKDIQGNEKYQESYMVRE